MRIAMRNAGKIFSLKGTASIKKFVSVNFAIIIMNIARKKLRKFFGFCSELNAIAQKYFTVYNAK